MPRDISRKRVFGCMTAATHWSVGCPWRLWRLEINAIDVHFQWMFLNQRGFRSLRSGITLEVPNIFVMADYSNTRF